MLTRRYVQHQYGFRPDWNYYASPYHVLMLNDAYPNSDGGGYSVSRYYQVPLNDAVAVSGTMNFRPYLGMDPSDPGTWPRPYNPQQAGLFMRLHQDGQAAARQPEKAVQGRRRWRRG